MDVMRIDRLREAANTDPEFRLAARFWNAVMRLDMGDTAYLIRMQDGQVAEVVRLDQTSRRRTAWNIAIAAPVEEWQKFLAPLPKPFYQDLWGAMNRHGFEVGGDLENFYQYYPAIRRLVDILRLIVNDV